MSEPIAYIAYVLQPDGWIRQMPFRTDEEANTANLRFEKAMAELASKPERNTPSA